MKNTNYFFAGFLMLLFSCSNKTYKGKVVVTDIKQRNEYFIYRIEQKTAKDSFPVWIALKQQYNIGDTLSFNE